jgi:hypothetical protein
MRTAFYQVATVSRVQSTTRYDSTKCQLIETVDGIMEDDMRVVFYSSQIHTKSNPVRAKTFPTNSGVVLERSTASSVNRLTQHRLTTSEKGEYRY